MSIIQIEEVLSTAQELTSNKENTHQWLDENGWDKKITYVQDVNNNIYEATLSIANARDGRKILYDISTKKVDHAEGSQNRSTARKSTSKYSISQNSGNVNYVNTDNKGRKLSQQQQNVYKNVSDKLKNESYTSLLILFMV